MAVFYISQDINELRGVGPPSESLSFIFFIMSIESQTIGAVYIAKVISDESLFYIGSTRHFKNRVSQHRNMLKSGTHKNSRFQSIYEKVGWDGFRFEILELAQWEDLIKIEQMYIDSLNPTINIHTIADRATGVKRSPITISRISRSKKGAKHSEEANRRKSIRQTGCKRRGVSHSLEARKKISENNAFKRRVYQFTLSGDFIAEYETLKDGALAIDTTPQSISGCVRGKLKHVKGFQWKYASEYPGKPIKIEAIKKRNYRMLNRK